jgi:hypothetical protein
LRKIEDAKRVGVVIRPRAKLPWNYEHWIQDSMTFNSSKIEVMAATWELAFISKAMIMSLWGPLIIIQRLYRLSKALDSNMVNWNLRHACLLKRGLLLYKQWGTDHTGQLRHHPLASPAVIV